MFDNLLKHEYLGEVFPESMFYTQLRREEGLIFAVIT